MNDNPRHRFKVGDRVAFNLDGLRIVFCDACGARWGIVGVLGLAVMDCPECGEFCAVGEDAPLEESSASVWSN